MGMKNIETRDLAKDIFYSAFYHRRTHFILKRFTEVPEAKLLVYYDPGKPQDYLLDAYVVIYCNEDSDTGPLGMFGLQLHGLEVNKKYPIGIIVTIIGESPSEPAPYSQMDAKNGMDIINDIEAVLYPKEDFTAHASNQIIKESLDHIIEQAKNSLRNLRMHLIRYTV